MRAATSILLLGAMLLAGCSDDPAPPFTIDGEGSMEGLMYLDSERSGLFDPADGDLALVGIGLEVRDRGTNRAFGGSQVTTGADGRFEVVGLPPGTHDLWVDEATLPEGALVCRNPTPVTIYRFESSPVLLGAEPVCLVTIQEAKESGSGTFVNIQGVVTAAGNDIRNDYTYVQDGTAGVRVFSGGFASSVERGQRVSLTGEVAVFNNDLQISSPSLGEVEDDAGLPAPAETTTAAIADAGPRNADPLQGRLVVVRGAQLVTGFVTGGSRNAEIDDGSGTTELRVETGLSSQNGDAILSALGLTVGECYDIIGVTGNFNGTGQIFPRDAADFTAVACGSE